MLSKGRFKVAIGAIMVAQAFASVPAGAQTQVAPPVSRQGSQVGEPVAQNDATITIFGRPKTSRSPGNGLTTIDMSKSGSGCGFMNRDPGQDVIDNYFDDFYGSDNPQQDDSAGTDEPPGSSRQRVNTRSPYGDVSQTNRTPSSGLSAQQIAEDPFGVTRAGAGGCTQAETNFAIGRAEIRAHDKSLRAAFEAFDAKDYPRALELFKYAYTKLGDFPGYDVAALAAGKMYLYGVGTPRDTKQAIVWLKKTVERPIAVDSKERQWFRTDNPEAMNTRTEAFMTLAKIYMLGVDVPKDPKEAVRWLKAADDWGYIPATHSLGRVYRIGYAGPKDIKKAVGYFRRAADVGYAPSQYALGEIYYYGDEGIPQDKTTAGAALLAAAKHGHPDALYAVGRMYELGEGGTKVDLAKALVYYKEAAVKGQMDAQNAIGVAFYAGNGLPKDLTSARRWFLTAAEKGNPDAMFNLAVMMVNGEGGPKDLVRAYCWFYIADKGGVEKAKAAMTEVAGKMTPEERAQAEALLNPKPAEPKP